MSEIDDLDAAFERAALSSGLLPPGEYAVRVDAAAARKSPRKGTHGLKLRLRIEHGPNAGRVLSADLWFTEGEAARITTETLEMLGLSNLKPSQVLALRDWSGFPWVWARVEHKLRNGRTFAEVRSFRRPDPSLPEFSGDQR